MSNTNVLQVRADPKLIAKAQKKADRLGFSSLQEIVRLFLTHLAKGKIEARLVTAKKERFPPEHIKLGPKASKRWERIMKESKRVREKGDYFATNSAEEAMEYLFGDER